MDMNRVEDVLTLIFLNVQLYVVPYAAFFAGIYVRGRYMAEKDTPSLKVLLVLGISVCLTIVTPIIDVYRERLMEFGLPYFATLGLIMEQGMVPHESPMSRLQKLLRRGERSAPADDEPDTPDGPSLAAA
jgi:hypothetical protein